MRSLLIICFNEITSPFITLTRKISDNVVCEYLNFDFNTLMSLGLVINPSDKLTKILSLHNLPKPTYILENGGDKGGIKETLNSISGVYICINLVNGKMYVGSASLARMYRRFRVHLYLAKGGSLIVNRAVKKYGVENFAFIVIETVSADKLKCKNTLISIEQKYIDLLQPTYNIVKIAGLKVSQETRDLMRNSALNRKVSQETRQKMSKNNAKSVKFTAYINGTVFKQFTSIADAAEFFFQDRTKRSKISKALAKHTLLLKIYELRKDKGG